MDPNTLHPFRTLYGSLKGALMVPFKGTLRVPYFRKLPHRKHETRRPEAWVPNAEDRGLGFRGLGV